MLVVVRSDISAALLELEAQKSKKSVLPCVRVRTEERNSSKLKLNRLVMKDQMRLSEDGSKTRRPLIKCMKFNLRVEHSAVTDR